MKDNINASVAINRKIVLELRISPQAKILDKKGTIADLVEEKKIFKPANFWQIGTNNNVVQFRDDNDVNKVRYSASVEFNKISFVCVKVDSVESYYNQFSKFYNALKEVIPSWNIVRIGCRIIGAYKLGNVQYPALLERIQKAFPSKFFLDAFDARKLLFKVDYQSGMYQFAPLKEDDPFFEKEFPAGVRDPQPGIMIDTDNFLIEASDSAPLDSLERIKSVFHASLAVEKALYENLLLLGNEPFEKE